MNFKPRFEDYTEAEFTQLVSGIFNAAGGEAYQDELIEHVCTLSEHPEGSDLIFYNNDEDITPQGIVNEIKTWRKANGKSGFKS
ncbi:bacteriocin immunity protein [Cronobacter turicensis]|uniref:bacteriocin immunity protein n=1 Tax=Cronobacter TaxID=413496 RepID=UPI00155237B0|nr:MULTISPECIES: bacteriocin immunity protein [Cronobacter]EMA8639882.1 bacteriocin immunity protein [Cronobacter malonaticus]EKM0365437.1 bacteriocin immunity protein [Cronobacter turicensis]EKM0531125.1 bacteriocin immunity protein [Cronobacter turicensis]ELY5850917.1 bacteriocin immunity protein [Cronobacter turicensis]MDK1335896.1 bacteriocin immunity protein [Cronobacter turicensis]